MLMTRVVGGATRRKGLPSIADRSLLPGLARERSSPRQIRPPALSPLFGSMARPSNSLQTNGPAMLLVQGGAVLDSPPTHGSFGRFGRKGANRRSADTKANSSRADSVQPRASQPRASAQGALAPSRYDSATTAKYVGLRHQDAEGKRRRGMEEAI